MKEERVDAAIQQIADAFKSADRKLWIIGLKASQLEPYSGALDQAALMAGCDRSAIENCMHAYQMYSDLRLSYFGTVPKLRRALSLKVFWTAWEKRRKYGLTLEQVYRELQSLLQYKRNSQPHGSETLRAEMEAHYGNDENGVTWEWVKPRLKKLVESALALNVPKDVRPALQTVLNWLDRQ